MCDGDQRTSLEHAWRTVQAAWVDASAPQPSVAEKRKALQVMSAAIARWKEELGKHIRRHQAMREHIGELRHE